MTQLHPSLERKLLELEAKRWDAKMCDQFGGRPLGGKAPLMV